MVRRTRRNVSWFRPAPRGKRLRLVLTWVLLLALLLASTGLAQLHLGAANLAVSLAIAALKAGLVVGVFMEWGRTPGLARALAIAGCLLLVLMGTLDWMDFDARRGEPRVPWQQPAVLAPSIGHR